MWQEEEFGGDVNQQPVNVQARNRMEMLETGGGSLGVFPPPHKFFFARENEVNLGYVYYRKDSDRSLLARRDAAGAWRGIQAVGRHR